MKSQRGLTLMSTLFVGILILAALLLGLKMVPVYNEYFGVKKALNTIVKNVDASAPPADFRRAFSRQSDIDDFSSVDPQTLVVTKSGGTVSLSVEYRRELHLFANVGLVFDFSAQASSTGGSTY